MGTEVTLAYLGVLVNPSVSSCKRSNYRECSINGLEMECVGGSVCRVLSVHKTRSFTLDGRFYTRGHEICMNFFRRLVGGVSSGRNAQQQWLHHRHTSYRMKCCVVHLSQINVVREPSWCMPNLEFHKILATFLIHS